ncbi:hypothetical protein ACFRCG_41675 [Embleya sp. NPDC056575]|uniref:hypothetical protein n=1 Tax=unclassified Embleya TaxID=2699296 RepID=UPI00369BBAE0
MTPDEVIDLLDKIALVDHRVVREDPEEQEAQVALWAGILSDVPAAFAGQAIGQHYSASPYPVLPADIAARWKTRRTDIMRRDAETEAPPVDPDRPVDYARALRAGRAAVATGTVRPRAIEPPRRLTEEDAYACLREGDIRELMRLEQANRQRENASNAAALRRHPELYPRLAEPPIGFTQPKLWSGFIPDGNPARRDALNAIVAEARALDR